MSPSIPVLVALSTLPLACSSKVESPQGAPSATSAQRSTAANPVGHPTATNGALGLDWLKLGPHAGDIMALRAPHEVEEIATRFKQAVATNKTWFDNYVKDHDGEVLPWHQKLGITQEEYNLMLNNKNALSLRKQRGTTLYFSESGDDVVLTTGGDWKFFDDLNVRIKKDGSVGHTSIVPLTQRRTVEASGAQSVTGPWTGTCWRHSGLTGLCLGKRKADGRGILFYEARVEGEKRPQGHSDFAILFDL